jgi:hypothetical protein
VPHRPAKALTLLASIVLVAGCDAAAPGVEHWRAGRFPEALAAFRDAETRAKGDASPEVLYDRALAATRAGSPAEVDAAADAAAARGGAEFAELRDFLRGNAAYSRAETSEFQADIPGSPPDSIDRAIVHAESARDAWTRAAAARSGWPAASRNARRAEILVEHLKKKKAAGPTGAKKAPNAKPRLVEGEKPPDDAEAPPMPEPPKPQAGPPQPPVEASAPPEAALSRAEVLQLLDRLDAKEREKEGVRRARRAAQAADVERDW